MIRRTYRAHPLMMLGIMKPLLFVLILPVIKGGLQYLMAKRITGVLTLEIIAATVVLFFSFLSFWAFGITVDAEKAVIRKGFLFKTVSVIKKDRLSCVSAGRSFFDLAFGSATYKVNTEAGASGKTDFSFKLYAKDAEEVSRLLYAAEERTEVRFNAVEAAILAAATSSAVSGLTVGVPVLNKLGKILGVALSSVLFSEISQASKRFDKYFPPAVNLATALIISGYLMSFFIGFIKMLGFRLRIGAENIEVEYGLVSRWRTVFKKAAVNNVCIEQTPFMRAFGMYSMRASVGGYGDKRGEKAIIVPAAKHAEIKTRFEQYFPFFCPGLQSVIPRRTKACRRRFLWPAEFFAAADIAATSALALLFPTVSGFLIFVGILIMAAAVYYGNLRLENYKTGRLCVSDSVFARGNSGFTVRELYCGKERVGEIRITRTPADRVFGTCNVGITVRSESADKIKVRNISFSETLDQIEKSFLINE